MKMSRQGNIEKKRVRDWNIGIPLVLWIWLMFLGLVKVFTGHTQEEGACEIVLMAVSAVNESTFSTFISVSAMLLYQHFSIPKEKRLESSPLAMGNESEMLVAILFYATLAVLDVAIDHPMMAVVYFVANIVYVILFFRVFIARRREANEMKEGQQDDSGNQGSVH